MTDHVNENVSWKSFQSLLPIITSCLKIILLIIIADILISIALSFVIDDTYYFNRYMKGTNYDDMVSNHHQKTLYVQPDATAGWSNTPNFKEGDGIKWTTDAIGSRVSPVKAHQADIAQIAGSDDLVFLVGSSVIDGYALPFEQSPAGYLTDKGYHVYGFGMSMYSIDQSYAFYKRVLSKYKPKVIVVGIHPEAEYISNMFVPFREDGKYTPYLKPAYHESGNQVVQYNPPFDYQHHQKIPEMLSELKEHDAFYYKYDQYKRLSLLPFSDLLRNAIVKFNQNLYDLDAYTRAVDLQLYFMQAINDLGKENGTEVIFVKFEKLTDQSKSIPRKLLTTVYPDKNTRHTQLLKDKPFNILYISDILKTSDKPMSEFYMENDPVHLTPAACQLLADQIDEEIKNISIARKQRIVKIVN